MGNDGYFVHSPCAASETQIREVLSVIHMVIRLEFISAHTGIIGDNILCLRRFPAHGLLAVHQPYQNHALKVMGT